MRDFVERLRAKPEHKRRQIALLTSGGVTGLVALAWVGAVASSGLLTVAPSENPESIQFATAVQETRSGFDELAAAAAAITGATTTEPELSIIETNTSSTIETKRESEERTVIPF